MSNQVNLKEKSTQELKALAFDLRGVVENYSQMYQTVTQEIIVRSQQEATAKQVKGEDKTPTDSTPEPEEQPKQMKAVPVVEAE